MEKPTKSFNDFKSKLGRHLSKGGLSLKKVEKGVYGGQSASKNFGMAKRKALQNRLSSIKGFGEGDPKKD